MSDSETPQAYGVAIGNGNDGVPDYYRFIVTTDDPEYLAELALISWQDNDAYRSYARDNAIIDGEAEYCISATLMDPPGEDEKRSDAIQAVWEALMVQAVDLSAEFEDCEGDPACMDLDGVETGIADLLAGFRAFKKRMQTDSACWSDFNGAWRIVEVRPVSADHGYSVPTYDSLADCFSADLLARFP